MKHMLTPFISILVPVHIFYWIYYIIYILVPVIYILVTVHIFYWIYYIIYIFWSLNGSRLTFWFTYLHLLYIPFFSEIGALEFSGLSNIWDVRNQVSSFVRNAVSRKQFITFLWNFALSYRTCKRDKKVRFFFFNSCFIHFGKNFQNWLFWKKWNKQFSDVQCIKSCSDIHSCKWMSFWSDTHRADSDL